MMLRVFRGRRFASQFAPCNRADCVFYELEHAVEREVALRQYGHDIVRVLGGAGVDLAKPGVK